MPAVKGLWKQLLPPAALYLVFAAVWALLLFMAVNIGVSSLALARYSARAAGQPAVQSWQVYMDEHYGDEVMQRIYPYAQMTG